MVGIVIKVKNKEGEEERMVEKGQRRKNTKIKTSSVPLQS